MGKLPHTLTLIALAALCSLGTLTASAGAASARPADVGTLAPDDGEKARPSVESDAVYYGDAKNFKKPGEVDPDRVYAEIDEYKEILEKDLKPGDPKYAILLQKASRRFLTAVRAAARSGGHDLVARSGAVQGVEAVPDVTQAVIDRL